MAIYLKNINQTITQHNDTWGIYVCSSVKRVEGAYKVNHLDNEGEEDVI